MAENIQSDVSEVPHRNPPLEWAQYVIGARFNGAITAGGKVVTTSVTPTTVQNALMSEVANLLANCTAWDFSICIIQDKRTVHISRCEESSEEECPYILAARITREHCAGCLYHSLVSFPSQYFIIIGGYVWHGQWHSAYRYHRI